MSRVETCLLCGHQGPDVAMALVDLEELARREGEAVRQVEVQLTEQLRHVQHVTRVVVPERYGQLPKCRDRRACDERQREQRAPSAARPMPEPVAAPADADEVPEWFRA